MTPPRAPKASGCTDTPREPRIRPPGTRVGGSATTGSLAVGCVRDGVDSGHRSDHLRRGLRIISTSVLLDNCSETPAEVVVYPKSEPEPEEASNPNLTILLVSASPTSVESGNTVTVRVTIENSGRASASSDTITVYRHHSRTANPQSGGIKWALQRLVVYRQEQRRRSPYRPAPNCDLEHYLLLLRMCQ